MRSWNPKGSVGTHNYGASGGNVGTLQTRSTNAANEITSVSGSWVTPTYDAAGNMVSAPKAGTETTRLWYVFDAWNRIVIVKNDNSGTPGSTLAEYAYDGLNRRITKDITGGDTFDDYFNENWQRLESRKNGDADPLDQFLWDVTYIDTPVLRWHDANTDGDLADVSPDAPGPTYDNTLYYTTDANHNVTALYDADQERVVERYVYDPYGKTFVYDRTWGAVSESAVKNDIQNGGYVTDKETGNVLARRRYKNIPLATWYVRDFGGYVDGANLYQYTRSEPTRFTDPSGLEAENAHAAAAYALRDEELLHKSNAYFTPSGLNTLFATLSKRLDRIPADHISYANLPKTATAKWDAPKNEMFISKDPKGKTVFHEAIHALDDANDWHIKTFYTNYQVAEALAYGAEIMVTYAQAGKLSLASFEKTKFKSSADAQQHWERAWMALNDIVGMTYEYPGWGGGGSASLKDSDLWDVRDKLKIHFSCKELLPIYERIVQSQGIATPCLTCSFAFKLNSAFA